VLKYALNRIALAIPTLLIVAVIVFVLMRAIPGDPAQLMLGDLENPRALEQMRRDLGLDRPIAVQFAIWVKRLLAGDLGNSIAQQRPVMEMLMSGFSVTASLVIPRW
jgi:peptide/nickel transport system permease protein